jgi:hypothetical protein
MKNESKIITGALSLVQLLATLGSISHFNTTQHVTTIKPSDTSAAILSPSLVMTSTPPEASTTTATSSISKKETLLDAQFIKAVDEDVTKAKVIARGDINNDGYEDAIVQDMQCGASCAVTLDAVLNIKNTHAKIVASKNDSPSFTPAFVGSSAFKSEITTIAITNGVIFLIGHGLACGNEATDAICTEEEWHKLTTVTYRYDGSQIVQISPGV